MGFVIGSVNAGVHTFAGVQIHWSAIPIDHGLKIWHFLALLSIISAMISGLELPLLIIEGVR